MGLADAARESTAQVKAFAKETAKLNGTSVTVRVEVAGGQASGGAGSLEDQLRRGAISREAFRLLKQGLGV